MDWVKISLSQGCIILLAVLAAWFGLAPGMIARWERDRKALRWVILAIVVLVGMLGVFMGAWAAKDGDLQYANINQKLTQSNQDTSALQQELNYVEGRLDYALRSSRPQTLSNRDLAKSAYALAGAMRSLYDNYDRDEESLSYQAMVGPGSTEAQKDAAWKQMNLNETTLSAKYGAIFDEHYRAKALYFYDELLKRLPPQPNAPRPGGMGFSPGMNWMFLAENSDVLANLALQLDPDAIK